LCEVANLLILKLLKI